MSMFGSIGTTLVESFIFLQLAVERCLSDSKKLGGLEFVALCRAQCIEDRPAFLNRKGEYALGRCWFFFATCRLHFMQVSESQVLQFRWKVPDLYFTSGCH